jgi:hypothetical protein
MSRTYRKYKSWVDWVNEFENRLKNGLVAVSKLEVLRDGRNGIDEVLGRRQKRYRRKLTRRARRIRDKEAIEEQFG